jgi:hypothetical protein
MGSTHKDLAAQLRRDADRYAREYGDRDDKEFQALMDRDVADLRRVAAVIEKGDLKRAYRIAERLDTNVRDSISNSVWKAMTGGAAFGHTEHDA